MRHPLAASLLILLASQVVHAQTNETPAPPVPEAGICLFTGEPPADYKYVTVTDLDYSKHTYGSVNDLLPRLVADAKAAGADAVIHYNGAQHFGFWPWQFVRPIVEGTAIKWNPPRTVDCAASGGVFTTGTLAEAPPPPGAK
jgi:hypothetical protein